MRQIKVSSAFECGADAFWSRYFFDAEFNRRTWIDGLGFPIWRVLEEKSDERKVSQRIEVQPQIAKLPAPIARVVGSSFMYVEEGTFDRRAQRYQFRSIPSVLADRITLAGEIYLESQGAGSVCRVVQMQIEARVFGIGSMMEDHAAKDLTRVWNAASRVQADLISRRTGNNTSLS